MCPVARWVQDKPLNPWEDQVFVDMALEVPQPLSRASGRLEVLGQRKLLDVKWCATSETVVEGRLPDLCWCDGAFAPLRGGAGPKAAKEAEAAREVALRIAAVREARLSPHTTGGVQHWGEMLQ